MYTNWKTRELMARMAAIPMRTRTARRRIRDRVRFANIIETVSQNRLPLKKYEHKIPIAFCFDGRGWKLAAVSIQSLLDVSHNRCDYDIYCVTDDTLDATARKKLTRIVQSAKSNITFLDANHDFDQSYRHKWPIPVYYRMMLPKLLPNVDQIIYADIDTIFCHDMIDISRLDMGKNILAGVRDYNNGYINSGFLVMNLRQIRTDRLYQKWISASRTKRYKNPDQDLLNFTTRGRTIFLPLKYNFQPMLGPWIFKAHTQMEIDDLKYNLVVLHFSNWMKPWDAPKNRPIFSEIWWNTAQKTGLFTGQ